MALDSPGHVPLVDKHSVALLTDLQHAHAALLKAMGELDELTAGPLNDRGRVIDARWNISSASLTRRTLWSRILAHVSGSAFQAHQADLRGLQETDIALLRFSCAHVAKWTIDAVMKDWLAYCPASREMRCRMKQAIDAEKRVLYPMLGGDGPARQESSETLK